MKPIDAYDTEKVSTRIVIKDRVAPFLAEKITREAPEMPVAHLKCRSTLADGGWLRTRLR